MRSAKCAKRNLKQAFSGERRLVSLHGTVRISFAKDEFHDTKCNFKFHRNISRRLPRHFIDARRVFCTENYKKRSDNDCPIFVFYYFQLFFGILYIYRSSIELKGHVAVLYNELCFETLTVLRYKIGQKCSLTRGEQT